MCDRCGESDCLGCADIVLVQGATGSEPKRAWKAPAVTEIDPKVIEALEELRELRCEIGRLHTRLNDGSSPPIVFHDLNAFVEQFDRATARAMRLLEGGAP